MPTQKCQTPSCPTVASDVQGEPSYCETCGWPLARATVTLVTPNVDLRDDAASTILVDLGNDSISGLAWDFLADTPGLTLVGETVRLAPHESRRIRLEVDPHKAQSGEARFVLRTQDQHGKTATDYRPASQAGTWREHAFRVLLMRRKVGPLVVGHRSLLFAAGTSTRHTLKPLNAGEVPLDVVVTVEPPFKLHHLDGGDPHQLKKTVPPGTHLHVQVSRPAGGTQPGAPPARLTVSCAGLETQTVQLVTLPKERAVVPREQYLISLDFGTSKSAIMVCDQHTTSPEPELVTWPRQNGLKEEAWVPSRVALDVHGRPRGFGWEVSSGSGSVVDSMKMHLLSPEARIQDAVVYFLRRLIEHTREVYKQRGVDLFADCRVLVSLPVLDNGPRYQEQLEATRKLVLQALHGTGLSEDHLTFCKEPESAALDFLHHLQQKVTRNPQQDGHLLYKNGDWMCVLDMGGGTTDVTFARIEIGDDGLPVFDTLHSIGYPLGGNTIDQGMLRLLMEHLKDNILEQGEAVLRAARMGTLQDSLPLKIKGEPRDIPVAQLRDPVRVVKEKMFETDPPTMQSLECFSRSTNDRDFVPHEVQSKVLDAMSGPIFLVESPEQPQPVRSFMQALPLEPSKIRFLCLTGGTTRIRHFKDTMLHEVLLNNENTQVVHIGDEDLRLNVVRGGTRRNTLRIKGRLPVSLDLRIDGKSVLSLDHGTVPGSQKTKSVAVECAARKTVELCASIPGAPTYTLYHFDLVEPAQDEEGTFLELRLEYDPARLLRLGLRWKNNNYEGPLPLTTVQGLGGT